MIQDPSQFPRPLRAAEQPQVRPQKLQDEGRLPEAGQVPASRYDHWQQYDGGPTDAQFVPGLESSEAANSLRPGMFVSKLREAVSNDPTELVRYRGLDRSQQEREAWLMQRDRDVEEHEILHEQVAEEGGVLAEGAAYDFETSASGKTYRVGGHVKIHVEETGDAKEDLRRGKAIKAAALAPLTASTMDASTLSEADKRVAQKGDAMIAKAEARLSS